MQQFGREPQLTQKLRGILLEDGLTAFDSWLRFDWMLDSSIPRKKLAQGTYFEIAEEAGHSILVVQSGRGQVAGVAFEDRMLIPRILEMFAQQVNIRVAQIGIVQLKPGSWLSIDQPENAKVALGAVRKLKGAPVDDAGAVMDTFIALVGVGALRDIQLDPTLSRERAEELVGERRSPSCIPFLLWAEICGWATHKEPEPTREELQEMYAREFAPFFIPSEWKRRVEETTWAYRGSSDNFKARLAFMLLHHFLPTLESVKSTDREAWDRCWSVRSALQEMISQFGLGQRAEELGVVYERLKPK